MTDQEIKKETEANAPSANQQPPKPKAKSNKPLFWGLITSLLVIVVFFIAYGAIRIYKYQANDKVTVALAKYLPYPAAMIDGSFLKYSEVKSLSDTLLYFLQYQAEANPGNELYKVPAYGEIFSDTFEQLVQNKFIEKRTKAKNLTVSQSEIDTAVKKMKDQAAQYGENIEESLLTFYQWTLDDFEKNVIAPQLLKDKLAVDVARDETITVNKEAKDKVVKIHQDIIDGIISFEDAAKQNSQDAGTAESGGDLGFFTADTYSKEINEAVSQLKIDEVSSVISTQYGYEILKLLEIKEEEGQATQYHAEHILIQTKSFEDWLKEEMDKAKIRRFVN